MKHTFLKKLTAVVLLTAVFVFSFAGTVSADDGEFLDVLLGDTDRDGIISVADARFVLRLTVSLEHAYGTMITVCDVDEDGGISAGDARLLLRKSVGLDSYTEKTVSVSVFDMEEEDPYAGHDTSIFNISPPSAPVIQAPSGTFTFVVYGYGHGVGLSQYGAAVMAKAGFSYSEILSYYYSGCQTVKYAAVPENTLYAGESINTYELVCRITQQEIGGITEGLPEAMKAQAVAVFTLLVRNHFSVEDKSSVGYAKSSFSYCTEECKAAVKAVLGEYVVRSFDASRTAVLTVYSAMCAGRSVGCNEIWYDNFPSAVSSPFEMGLDNFISVVTYTKEEVKKAILDYDSDIVLSDNPAEWISVVSHNASIDEDRGYVTQIMVGNTLLSKVEAFNKIIYLRSGCFTVTYTP